MLKQLGFVVVGLVAIAASGSAFAQEGAPRPLTRAISVQGQPAKPAKVVKPAAATRAIAVEEKAVAAPAPAIAAEAKPAETPVVAEAKPVDAPIVAEEAKPAEAAPPPVTKAKVPAIVKEKVPVVLLKEKLKVVKPIAAEKCH